MKAFIATTGSVRAALIAGLALLCSGVCWAQDAASPPQEPAIDEVLEHVGIIYVRSPDEAWAALEGVRELAAAAADPVYEAEWNLAAAVVESARGNLEAAISFVETGHALFLAHGTFEDELWATLVRGETRSAIGRYRLAIEDFEFVLAQLDERGESQAVEDPDEYAADAWLGLGGAHTAVGDFASALEALRKAFELSGDRGDDDALSAVYGLLGNVYTQIDALEQAVAIYEEATELDRAEGDDLNVSVSLYNTGRAYTDLGRTEDARALYEEALMLARRVGSPVTEGYVMFGIGLSYMGDGNDLAAREAFEQARSILAEVGDEVQLASVREQLARLALRAGNVADAQALAEAAIATLESAGDEAHLITALDVLGQALAARGSHAAAYQASARRAELMKRVASRERARRVAHLRVLMDTDRAEGAVRALGEEAALREEELAAERMVNRVVLTAALVLLVLLVLLAWSFAKLKRLEARVRHHANTDDLTGTLSRRRLFELGDQEINRAARYEKPLAALLLDLDYFKAINDRHGHGVGDEVLSLLARHVSTTLRDSDLFGRIGGEEFLVILPEAGRAQALAVAERLVAEIDVLDLSPCGIGESVSVSVGVSAFQGAGDTLVQMVRRADAALYQAKRQGRNRACAEWALED